jgi:hypothetical protein
VAANAWEVPWATLGGGVAQGDGDQHGQAEAAADLLGSVLHGAAQSGVGGAETVQCRVEQADEADGLAEGHDQHSRQDDPGIVAVDDDPAHQEQAEGGDQVGDDEPDLDPDGGEKFDADAETDEQHHPERPPRQPGAERRVVEHVLHVEGQREEQAEEPGSGEHGGDVGPHPGAIVEEPLGDERVGADDLRYHQRDEQPGADSQGHDDGGPEKRRNFSFVALWCGDTKAVVCCSDDNVDARLGGKHSAVENDVVEPRVVLMDIKKHSSVCFAGSVDRALTLSGSRLVDTQSDNLGNARLNRAVKSRTKNIWPVAQHGHSRPAKNDGSGGVGHLLKGCFHRYPKSLRCAGDLSRRHDRPNWRGRAGQCGDDSLPTARSVFVKTLRHIFGQVEPAGGGGCGNGAVNEREVQLPSNGATDLVAVRTIRR